MNRREFKRCVERTKIQVKQKEQFQRGLEYKVLQDIVDQCNSGKAIDVSSVLIVLEKLFFA